MIRKLHKPRTWFPACMYIIVIIIIIIFKAHILPISLTGTISSKYLLFLLICLLLNDFNLKDSKSLLDFQAFSIES